MSDSPLDLSYKPDVKIKDETANKNDVVNEEKDDNLNKIFDSKEISDILAKDSVVREVKDCKFFVYVACHSFIRVC